MTVTGVPVSVLRVSNKTWCYATKCGGGDRVLNWPKSPPLKRAWKTVTRLWEAGRCSSLRTVRKWLLTCFYLFFPLLGPSQKSEKFCTNAKTQQRKGLIQYLSLGLCSSKTSFVYQKWMSEERMNDAFFLNCTIHKLHWGMSVYISCPSQNFTIKTPSLISCRSSIKTVVVAKAIKLKHMSKYNFYWTTGWKWKHRGCFVKSIHYRIYVKK